MTAAATAAALVLAGCAGGDSGSSSSTAPIVVASDAVAENIDPDAPSGVLVANYAAVKNLYEPLVRWGYTENDAELGGGNMIDASEPEPGLATAWSYADDAWTFTLREGVISPAGNEFTAADVVWSYDRNAALEGTGAMLWSTFMGVQDVTAIDDRTVKISTDGPSPMLLPTLATASYIRPIDSTEAKKHVTDSDPWAAEWLGQNAAGFGAYTVDEWAKPQTISYVPSDNYWDRENVSDLEVRVRAVADPAQRLNAVQGGDADVVTALTPQQLNTAMTNDALNVVRFNANGRNFIYPNYDDPNIGDPAVLRAMWTAIPSQQILDQVYNGNGFLLSSNISPYLPGHTDEFFDYEYDMDRAKALMAATDKAAGFKTDLYFAAEEPVLQQIGTIVKDSWAQLGIDVTLHAEPNAQLQTRNYSKGNIPLYMEDMSATEIPDACSVGALWRTGGIANSNQYDNPAFDAAFETCLASAEFAEREPAMKDLQREGMETPMVLGVLGLYRSTVTGSDISGVAFDPSGAVLFASLERD